VGVGGQEQGDIKQECISSPSKPELINPVATKLGHGKLDQDQENFVRKFK